MRSVLTTESSPGEAPARSGAAGREASGPVLAASCALLTLCALFTLFIFRGVDDNRLTSWQWVFADGDVAWIAGILVAGLGAACGLARLPFPGRRPGLVLFVAAFVAGAAFWKEPEVIVDAARYFTQAKELATQGVGSFVREWGAGIPAWTDLPLVPFLYGVVFALAGEARLGIQILTTGLFAGSVVLTYLLGKALWDDTVGLSGGALLLGMPYLLTQVPLMLVDVPTMFFLTLAMWTTVRAVGQGGRAWVSLAAVSIVAAALSKYSTWPLLSVVPVIFLIHLRGEPRAVLRRAAGVSLGVLLLVGTVLLWKSDVIADQLGLLQRYQVPGLRRWGESFISTFLFQVHPFVTVAAACSIVVAVRRRDFRYAIIGWGLLLVLVLRIERIRYLLVVFPMLALMASYGLREIRRAELRRFAVSCIVASSLVVAFFAYLPHLMSVSAVNLKSAGAYLDSLEAESVEVFALSQARSGVNPAVSVSLLDLFTTKRIVYRQESDEPLTREEIETSPLRFTWEYRTPGYYAGGGARGQAVVVVIAAHQGQSLPDQIEQRIKGYRLSKAFETTDEWFEYQTLVRVYERADRQAGGTDTLWL